MLDNHSIWTVSVFAVDITSSDCGKNLNDALLFGKQILAQQV